MKEAPGDALKICKHTVALFLVQAGKRNGKELIIGHQLRRGVRMSELTMPSVYRSSRFGGATKNHYFRTLLSLAHSHRPVAQNVCSPVKIKAND